MRVFFVGGGLYAIGVFLIGYRGCTEGENHLYTLAGICAIAVGKLPMNSCEVDVQSCEVAKVGNGLYVLHKLHHESPRDSFNDRRSSSGSRLGWL